MWEVLFTETFNLWWETLTEAEQTSLLASIHLLRQLGPGLPRPHADTLKGSRHSNMKELRTQHQGRPLRTFFAFDPLRRAILLVGGDKTGDNRFYDRLLRQADDLFDAHLASLTPPPPRKKRP